VTPVAQVWHVFIKDVRQQRWLLLIYLLLVIVATGHALEWRALENGVFGGTMMIVGLVVLLLVAAVIQGDSPTRSDAFWASHPLDPYAVLGAKVLFALVVLAIAVIGQAIAIQSFAPTAADTGELVVHPALSLAAVMLVAALVASLTRDLRTFLVAAIVLPIVTALTMAVVTAYVRTPAAFRTRNAVMIGVRWVALVLAAALIVWLYRTRDSRWWTRVGGYVLVGIAAVTLFVGGVVRAGSSRNEAANAPTAPRARLWLMLPADRMNEDPAQLSLVLEMPPLPEQLHLAVHAPSASVHFRDGSSAEVTLGYGYMQFIGGSAARPIIPGVRWLADAGRSPPLRIPLRGMLTPAQRLALDAGGASVVVSATVEVDTIEAGIPLPLATGRVVKRDGRRTTIDRWSHYGAQPEISLHSTSLSGDDTQSEIEQGQDYALINRRRGEALPLNRLETGLSIDGLVLPATTLTTSRARLTDTRGSTAAAELPADDWYRDAELLPIVHRTLGSYPVKLTLTIPPR
jgi:hypothetical protein